MGKYMQCYVRQDLTLSLRLKLLTLEIMRMIRTLKTIKA